MTAFRVTDRIRSLFSGDSPAAGDDGKVLAYNDATGSLEFTDIGTQTELNAAIATVPLLTPTTSTRNVVQPSAADKIPFTVKGFASQSTDLFDWAKSDDTVYLRVNKNGYLINRKVAAPADAELAANEMALWLDATDGAGKLMVKAKTANGTVATAAVSLT